MSQLHILRYFRAVLAVFLALPFASRAQPQDPPVGVAVKICTKGYVTNYTASLNVSGYFLSGTPGSGDTYVNTSVSTEVGSDLTNVLSDGSAGYVRVEPAKSYMATISGSNVGALEVSVVAPPGYRVLMDNLFRTREVFPSSGSVNITFQLIPLGARHPGLAGLASSISSLEIEWRVSLGSLRNGASAGDLELVDTGTRSDWSSIFTGASLFYEPPSDEINVVRSGNTIRQIRANQVAIDIVPLPSSLNPTSFEIRCYNPAQASTTVYYNGGMYNFSGQPYLTYRVESGPTNTSLKITKEAIDVVSTTATNLPVARREIMSLTRSGTWPSVSWTKTDWTLENQAAVGEVDVVSSGTTLSRTEAITVKVPNGAIATKLTRNYSIPTNTAGQSVIGEVLSSESVGTSTGLDASFTYNTDTNQWSSLGYLKSASLPGGNWVAYDYWDGDPTIGTPVGRVKHAYRPYLNAPATISQSVSTGDVTYYEYWAPDVFGAYTQPTLIQRSANGTIVSKATIGYGASSVPIAGNGGGRYVARTEYSASGANLTTTTNYYAENYADSFYRGQTISVRQPDATKQSFAYERGNWTNGTFTRDNTYGHCSRVSVIGGTAINVAGSTYSPDSNGLYEGLYLIDGKSTKGVTIRDERALAVRSESYGWKNNGWVLLTWTNFTYDMAGRLTQRVKSNGGTYIATYSGGLKTSETDDAGVTTTFTYDAGGRMLTSTRVGVGAIPSVTTKYTYDAADHALQKDVGYGQSEVLTTQAQYDDAGRITVETPPGAYGVVTHSYDAANRTATVTNADGGTVIAINNLDGSPASMTGTATLASYHTYGIETDGRQWHQVNSGTVNSPRWQKSWTDWLGRAIETDAPGFTGQPTIVATNVYENGTGRLIKKTRTGYVPTLYQYDALGQVSRFGLDYDNNGSLDLASSDRIAETESYFENFGNAWWLRTDTRSYPKLGVNALIVMSISRTRLTGFPANRISEGQEIDAEGNVTTKVVDVNRTAATAVATETTTGISGSIVENTVAGVPVSLTSLDGLTTSIAYDTLLRPKSVTDSRSNTRTSVCIMGTTLVQSITDAVGDVSVTGYDAVGRVSWQRDPKNFYTRFSYNLRGQPVHTWGDGAIPVEYGYDPVYGDKTSMSTFRAGSGWSGTTWPTSPGAADTTTWMYDAPSGLLTAKTDATGKAVTQTYNIRGQTAVRTLARGTTTAYGYDSATGELLTQTYSDSTPAVAYTYGRTGQIETVADYTGLRDLVYDTDRPWRLTAEVESDYYGKRVLTRNYDDSGVIGRVNGFQLGTDVGSNADLQQTFGFTTIGRFGTITTNRLGNSATAHTFRYSYLSNAAMLQSVALDNSGFAITRSYEAHRDLITSIDAQWSTASRTRYDYSYDERGQRTSSVQSGDAFADYGDSTFHLFTYDGRGQVTGDVGYLGSTVSDQSKPLPGRHYGYGYDNAGNRTWSDRTGVDANNDGLPDLRDNYTTNSLNQYVSRENNSVPVSGTALTDTSPTGGAGGTAVNVKGRTVAAGRQGRYWNDEIVVSNTLHPWRGPVTIFTAKRGTAGSPDVYRLDSRMVEIAAVLQTFTYDEDGNLMGDGLVDYTWDAENRLVRMETSANAQTYGFPHRLLEFQYDYMGRRVQKRVTDIDQNLELYNRRYCYDGWNLVAEYAVISSPSSLVLLRSYTWGLDIALSQSNAGGVGALLQIVDHPTGKTYLPTYDGNGNIVSLLNAGTGALAAIYEYSPFGEPLRAQTYDTTIADNPWRFSTKWTDLETGLVYYGHRYYDPHNGRFINRDPIEESGGLNLYGFCDNNAVGKYDALGCDPTDSYGWLNGQMVLGGPAITMPTFVVNGVTGYSGSNASVIIGGPLNPITYTQIISLGTYNGIVVNTYDSKHSPWMMGQLRNGTFESLPVTNAKSKELSGKLGGGEIMWAEVAASFAKGVVIGAATAGFTIVTGGLGGMLIAGYFIGTGEDTARDIWNHPDNYSSNDVANLVAGVAGGALGGALVGGLPGAKAPSAEYNGLMDYRTGDSSTGFTKDPLVMMARVSRAVEFLRSSGIADTKISGYLAGIDFTLPVEVATFKAGTQLVAWTLPGKSPGAFYTLPGVSPSSLGIYTSGLVENTVTLNSDVTGLVSTAANIVVDWQGGSTGGVPTGWSLQAIGGGIQFQIPGLASALRPIDPASLNPDFVGPVAHGWTTAPAPPPLLKTPPLLVTKP